MDTTGYPPTITVGDELLFVNSRRKEELIRFVTDNNIKTLCRPDIWSWILEPFLDTEYTADTDKRLKILLAEYGLTEEIVSSLRQEVEIQMLKYNFDTMLWDWTNLGASDVLRAMRPKYDKDQYYKFYRKAMEIALTDKLKA